MIGRGKVSYITAGDFIDLYHKIRQVGITRILSKFRFGLKERTISKWNKIIPSANFWDIPLVKRRINEKCTGNPEMGYEDYFVIKYLAGRQNQRMLSIGSGTGTRERRFAQHAAFSMIEGIDIAPSNVDHANRIACQEGLVNLKFLVADFASFNPLPETYDVILFNSSLHHFKNIRDLLEMRVLPLLKKDGFLVVYEYVGPNKLQWTNHQLVITNELLSTLPEKFKRRFASSHRKVKIYRPGLLRMLAVDPSEAVDSESIIPALHGFFNVLEEKQLGWDILQPLMKDIAQNFLSDDDETKQILNSLFAEEDKYLEQTGRSDGVFGVYQRK